MRNLFAGAPTFFLFGAILTSLSVTAQTPSPPQEFWEYLEEYSDDKGDLLDPLDYEQISAMKDEEESTAPELTAYENELDEKNVAPVAKRVKSSAHASSAQVKGPNL